MAADMHDIPELDASGLRKFAFTLGAALIVVFGLFFPWALSFALPLWPWLVAAVLAAWGLVAPASLGPVYRGWMRFGLLLGRIVSPVVIGAMFFLIISPVALVMRLAGRDAMARRIDRNAVSYRITSQPSLKEHMERPF